MLKIGQINYANCLPLFHILKERFSNPAYEFVSGVPAVLNDLLFKGKIDVCPSSSIEYAFHPDKYCILPDLSISSDGPVASVLLFSKIPIDKLNGCKILLSSESATSVNLLKILMKQLYCCNCSYEVTTSGLNDALDDAPALLLIGDSALRASVHGLEVSVYDLGEIWNDWTGLPFVFALWLCRKEVSENEEMLELSRHLIQAKHLTPLDFERIAILAEDLKWMSPDLLSSYWQKNISYNLDQRSVSGLITFYEKCSELNLIGAVPAIRYLKK